ncbi:MAG TPA: hypothetical protein VFH06_05275 [Candidatus Saccharimonadales bacterium]|nr:hypothetical protein [Candidatus Saccharimonadales bacterium]
MSYGEIYILQNDSGNWLIQEDYLPGSLEEARKWEAFGKHIGEKLIEIALLQDSISNESPPAPVVTLAHSDIQRGRHSKPIERHPRSPNCYHLAKQQSEMALRAIHTDIQHMHYLLTENQEQP